MLHTKIQTTNNCVTYRAVSGDKRVRGRAQKMSTYRKMMVSYCATFDKTIESIVTMFYHEDDHDDHGDDMN